MNLKLHKPLCIFDLETTGINISKDRIVEICILKVFPDASRESKTWLVNPEMPIPKESSDIHGITDEMVADKPTLKEIAPKIIDMIKDSDLGGFNSNRFDIPLLAEELLRVGSTLICQNINQSMYRLFSIRWNLEIFLLHTNSTVESLWRTLTLQKQILWQLLKYWMHRWVNMTN